MFMHSQTNERRIVDFTDIGIPEVQSLGRYKYYVARPGPANHSRPAVVEICYLARGYQTYQAGGHEYRLVGGDVFITTPGEPSETAGQPEGCGAMYSLIVRLPKKGGSLLALPSNDSEIVVARLSRLLDRHFPGRPVLRHIFRHLFEIYDQPANALKRVTLVSQLLRCILEVLDSANHHHRRNCSEEIAKVVQMIRSCPEEEFSLEELAATIDLSLSRFKARFKAEMGIGPHEFIVRNKVEAAKKSLLDEDETVTNVAMRYGFSSSQYFATVFRRFTDLTPLEFRACGYCAAALPATTEFPRTIACVTTSEIA
jgi:AraC-like DNA-binding protein